MPNANLAVDARLYFFFLYATLNWLSCLLKQIVQMKPWQRTWAARRLSNQFVSAIERASAPNRVPRGLVVDLDTYNENAPVSTASR